MKGDNMWQCRPWSSLFSQSNGGAEPHTVGDCWIGTHADPSSMIYCTSVGGGPEFLVGQSEQDCLSRLTTQKVTSPPAWREDTLFLYYHLGFSHSRSGDIKFLLKCQGHANALQIGGLSREKNDWSKRPMSLWGGRWFGICLALQDISTSSLSGHPLPFCFSYFSSFLFFPLPHFAS